MNDSSSAGRGGQLTGGDGCHPWTAADGHGLIWKFMRGERSSTNFEFAEAHALQSLHIQRASVYGHMERGRHAARTAFRRAQEFDAN